MHTFLYRIVSALCLVGLIAASALADPADVRDLIELTGISKGVCSLPNCGTGTLAMDIARQSDFLVHGFEVDQNSVNEAVAQAVRTGLWGSRVVFERLASDPLPYADNFVDFIVIDDAQGIRAAEIFRVVRPRGCALVRKDTKLVAALGRSGFTVADTATDWMLARKPALEGADDWPLWCHSADNNPVSKDTAIHAPYLTQWFGKPYYNAMPVVSTVAAGRVFIASGHIAHHDREIPTLNTLAARNGYNGRALWQHKLPPGYLVHRSAFIATEDVFYMIDGDSVLELDAETGAELGRLRIPGIKGTLQWIVKLGDVLYALSGENEPPTEIMKVHAAFRGWAWSKVDRNYSPNGKHQIRWGFGNTLIAYDLAHDTLLWKHEQSNIDSRGLGIFEDKLFYYVPATKLVCLDRRTGETLWRNDDREKLVLIEDEAKGLAGTPGFRTAAMLLATPVGIFLQGQKRANVLAFSVDDGHFLWSKKKFHNNPNMLYVHGTLYISGIQNDGAVQALDPQTGTPRENLHFWKGSCTRLTGSPEALYCRGEGLGRYDLQTKTYQSERTARPGCNDGAIAANGLLYVGPWLCDCNLSILGQMVLGPAGRFEAHAQTLSDSHLETVASRSVRNVPSVNGRDWPVYRANNQRTASSVANVPSAVHTLWQSAARTEQALQSQPVTAGRFVFVAGADGFVRCLDAEQGKEKWTFATGGPVLASPTIWEGRVFVGSGDGSVYCLEAMTGTLLWRFRVAPIERRIMIYGRLASNWPVNSGVLIHEGTAYAAAGVVFRDGTHVVALDARSGKLQWHNGTVGKPTNGQNELHAASALGTLAIGRDRLWLASGNVVAPVSFDLRTGEANVLSAQRTPVWNTVMAQKPEPAGRDIMVFRDHFLMHGGRLLYSGIGQVVSSAQVNFRTLGEEGRPSGPAFTPVRHCAIPPAWDDQVFVTLTSRYGDLLGWRVSEVEKRLQDALAEMTEMDQKIPGTSAEKWGQYNRIGKVFNAVERELRATSVWPVIRANISALAVTQNAVVISGHGRDSMAACFVAAYGKTDGKPMWKVNLPAEPLLEGLAINRDGSAIVTLADGSVLCVGNLNETQ